jgi:PaaX-like protein
VALGEFGVTGGAARTTISRLARPGVLESSRHGRHCSYRLTGPAAIDLSNGGGAIAAFGVSPEPWDGSWTVVSFSVPEQEARNGALRNYLRWWGFAPPVRRVWVWPHPLPAEAHAELAERPLGSMSLFRAQHLDLPTKANRSPIDAWDIPAIAEQYKAFIRRWSGLEDQHPGDTVDKNRRRRRQSGGPGRGWVSSRLTAIDGTTFDLPDTKANVGAFGRRPRSGRGEQHVSYPQIRMVGLVECGTHVVFDAAIGLLRTGEHALAQDAFAALRPGMLC